MRRGKVKFVKKSEGSEQEGRQQPETNCAND